MPNSHARLAVFAGLPLAFALATTPVTALAETVDDLGATAETVEAVVSDAVPESSSVADGSSVQDALASEDVAPADSVASADSSDGAADVVASESDGSDADAAAADSDDSIADEKDAQDVAADEAGEEAQDGPSSDDGSDAADATTEGDATTEEDDPQLAIAATGWVQTSAGTWNYIDPKTGVAVTGEHRLTGFDGIAGWYYFDTDGTMVTGEKYRSDDAKHTGWYLFDTTTGRMLYRWQWLESSGGKTVYYHATTGIMVKGEAKLEGADGVTGWYYLDPGSGAVTYGWKKVPSNGGKWVYYDTSSGRMLYGQQNLHDNNNGTGKKYWYYFNDTTGATTYGFKYIASQKKTVYYAPVTGKMQYGTKKIGSYTYSFNTTTGACSSTYATILAQSLSDGLYSASLYGTDISSYQASIKISSLSTTDFVIVKATQGTWYVNSATNTSLWSSMASQTVSSGKLLGLYHFIEAGSSATAQADFFVSKVSSYAGSAVFVLDWENTTGSDVLSLGPSFAKTFLDRVYQKTGVRPLIYMSRSVAQSYDWSSVVNAGYGLWVAQYKTASSTGYKSVDWDDGSGYGAWAAPVIYQYTANGRVTGYSGILDLNVFYGTKEDWKALAAKS